MNKKYLKPETQVVKIECGAMMAANSTGIADNGECGASKFSNNDDWDEEE